jgi:hypothetical protein
MRRILLLLLLTACTNDRPWTVIEVRPKGNACEYVLSRSNGFGPQVKNITAKCGKYQLFQTINPSQMNSSDKASQMIIDLQDKNAKLRLGLGKLLQVCKNTKMNERSEIWNHYMGLAQQMMDETDPNGKWNGMRL